jgi:two-component system nitrate/nitrite response regulator NarL
MRCVTIVIADRHPVFVCGLTSVLGALNDFKVVSSARDGTECIDAIRRLSPDMALLDIFMPGLSGLDILAAVASEHLSTHIVFLTEHADDRDLIVAVARGAYGVIFKDAAPHLLVQCLRQVAEGRRSFALTNGNGIGINGNVLMVLTDRERQIMNLVAEGWSNKEVGRQLDISDGTIKVHLHHIYRKLAISNRTALAALAHTQHDNRSWDRYSASRS